MALKKIPRFLDKVSRKLGLGYAFSPPRFLSIEHTNRCNLNCRSCARFFFGGEYQDMEPAILEKVRREIVPLVDAVALSGYGEPLLNPAFDELLEFALGMRKKVSLISNGVLLDARRIEKLFRGGCDLYLSIDGATNETMLYLRGVKLDTLLRKIEQFRDLRAQNPPNDFHLFVICVLSRRNIEEIPDLIRILEPLRVDGLIVQDAIFVERDDDFVKEKIAHHPGLARRLFPVIRRTAEECGLQVRLPFFPWLNEEDAPKPGADAATKTVVSRSATLPTFTGPTESTPSTAPAPAPPPMPEPLTLPHCFRPWSEVYVDVYGNVKACCFGAADPLGSLKTQSFRAIWNGPGFRALRRTVNTARPPEYCKICGMR